MTRDTAWGVVQIAMLGVGVFLVAMLLFKPEFGLFLLWDALIPTVPLLLAVAPGVWRNVCPLATVSMLPHRLKMSREQPVSPKWHERFMVMAVVLLLAIVPLRHAILDRFGVMTGTALLIVGAIAFCLGLVFDRKAAWCSGLCPVSPVELLYGTRPVVTAPNMQCRTCTHCIAPCRDVPRGITPPTRLRQQNGRTITLIFIGCFPGFVLGWHNALPRPSAPLSAAIAESYLWTLSGAVASLILFLILYRLIGNRSGWLVRLFASAAMSAYYWFKLPVMLGMTGDASHALLHLDSLGSDWLIWPLRLILTAFCCYQFMAPSRIV